MSRTDATVILPGQWIGMLGSGQLGQMFTLAEVLTHYNEAPLSMIGHNEAKPLGLNAAELLQLEAFLKTLAAPLATDEKWLRPPDISPGSL